MTAEEYIIKRLESCEEEITRLKIRNESLHINNDRVLEMVRTLFKEAIHPEVRRETGFISLSGGMIAPGEPGYSDIKVLIEWADPHVATADTEEEAK